MKVKVLLGTKQKKGKHVLYRITVLKIFCKIHRKNAEIFYSFESWCLLKGHTYLNKRAAFSGNLVDFYNPLLVETRC